ncbi:unnamed protein product [Arctia plantaginis]|uniref:EF-hand domain-containing protein n=1 Tax=Arctia plantaginis TaxID=874455 RepID=A0A8S1AUP5_ARCPL|nr:unnamed protein product [Arctia plantaginis]
MVNRASRDKIPINLSKDEIQTYIKRFQIIDKDRKGFVSINDIRRSLKSMGVKPTDDEIRYLLSEIDLTYHGQLELQDYLQVEISYEKVGIWCSWDTNHAIVVHVSFSQNYGEEVTGEQLHEILKEIDTNMNGQVELDEYLQMMSAIKSGHVAYSRSLLREVAVACKHQTIRCPKLSKVKLRIQKYYFTTLDYNLLQFCVCK